MEELIIQQLKQGNNKAYEYLYRKHYSTLCRIAYEYVNDHFLAETIAGDVIFHLWEKRETIEIYISLRSYLVQAVRNRSLDYLYSLKERKEVTFSSFTKEYDSIPEKYIVSDNYPLGKLLEQELEKEISSAIENLPEECKKVFIKSRFENKKYDEIAKELNISVNTVKYHIKNAILFLNRKLYKYLILIIYLLLNIK